jgi:hypothetical protein
MCVRVKAVEGRRHTKRSIPGRGKFQQSALCDCRLTVKTYPGTETILGMYQPEHCHPIGNENTCFTCLPDKTHAEIERLLRLGVEPKAVV